MKSVIISVLICYGAFFNAFSQDQTTISRKGFVVGTSVGMGESYLKFPEKSEFKPGIALDIKLGWMLKPNLALMLSTNVSVYSYSGFGRDRKRDFGVLAPTVQYWWKDRFWVLGGVGLGGDNPVFWDIDYENVESDPLETRYFNGFGLMAATGYEFYQRKKLVLDVKAKVMYRNVNMLEGNTNGASFSLLLGINFY